MSSVFYGVVVPADIAFKRIIKARYGEDNLENALKLISTFRIGPEATFNDVLNWWVRYCSTVGFILVNDIFVYADSINHQVFIGKTIQYARTQVFKKIPDLGQCVDKNIIERVDFILGILNLQDFETGFFHGDPREPHEELVRKSRLA